MNAFQRLSIPAVFLLAGAALAQDQYASGVLHSPLGGATLDPPVERRLPVRNIGSSGQDGVEIKWPRTTVGASVQIGMSGFLSSSPGSEIKIRHKGWDGLIYHQHRISGSFALGHVDEEASFSSLGPPGSVGMQITCIGSTGATSVIVHEADTVNWTTEITYGPGEQPSWELGAGKVSVSDLSFMVTRRSDRPGLLQFATATGGVISVPDVVEVQCRPICIVAPCPGDWTNLSATLVTGVGMSEISCDQASVRRMLLPTLPPPPRSCGTGFAQLSGLCCADLDGDGVDDEVLVCDNLGSSGQDGVATDFPGGCDGARRKWGNGHVTLMKITDDEGSEMRLTSSKDDLACTTTFTPDFSSLGSTQWTLTARDRFGNPLINELVIGLGESCTVSTCGGTGGTTPALHSTIECRKAGEPQPTEYLKIEFRDDLVCSPPGGAPQTGVASIEMRPYHPLKKLRKIFHWRMTSLGGTMLVTEPEILPDLPTACPADVDNGTGSGDPDGGVDIQDLLFFLAHFEAGC